MFRTTVLTATLLATVSIAATAMAGPPTIKPGSTIRPAGFAPPTLSCVADPAIASVTLTKGSRPGQVSISYVVVNAGASAWRSGADQQAVYINAVNGNTGGAFTTTRALTGSAASGAVMQRFTTPMIAGAFDSFEFGGHLDLMLSYDPDIFIDGNCANDDRNEDNNRVHIDNSQILAFMNGAARSQTFRP